MRGASPHRGRRAMSASWRVAAAIALALVGSARAEPASEDRAMLFQEGLFLERTLGDTEAALARYDEALAGADDALAVRVQLRRAALLAARGPAQELRTAVADLRRRTADAEAWLGPARYFPERIDLVIGLDASSLRLAPLLGRVAPEAVRWLKASLGFDPLSAAERLYLGLDLETAETAPARWVAAVVLRPGVKPDVETSGAIWLDDRTVLQGEAQTRELAQAASRNEAVGLAANLALSQLLARLPRSAPLWLAATRVPDSMVPGEASFRGLRIAARLDGDLHITAAAETPDRERARSLAAEARKALARRVGPQGLRWLDEPTVEADGATTVLTARLPAKLVRGAGGVLDLGRTDLVGAGVVDRAQVARHVRAQRRGIDSCIETRLARPWDLTGKVVVQFTIGEDGAVTKASVVERSVRAPRLIDCLVSRVEKWSFPPPAGGEVVVSQSFRFGRKR